MGLLEHGLGHLKLFLHLPRAAPPPYDNGLLQMSDPGYFMWIHVSPPLSGLSLLPCPCCQRCCLMHHLFNFSFLIFHELEIENQAC